MSVVYQFLVVLGGSAVVALAGVGALHLARSWLRRHSADTLPLARQSVKRFLLVRKHDATGVSGIGAVAEGVMFSSGKAVMHWSREPRSVAVYESIEELEYIHGHGGRTTIVWVDE